MCRSEINARRVISGNVSPQPLRGDICYAGRIQECKKPTETGEHNNTAQNDTLPPLVFTSAGRAGSVSVFTVRQGILISQQSQPIPNSEGDPSQVITTLYTFSIRDEWSHFDSALKE